MKAALVFVFALGASVILSSAAHAKKPLIVGAGNTGSVSVSGKVHINQNGNGCRNRCYGEQTFNAGFNNGNSTRGRPSAEPHYSGRD